MNNSILSSPEGREDPPLTCQQQADLGSAENKCYQSPVMSSYSEDPSLRSSLASVDSLISTSLSGDAAATPQVMLTVSIGPSCQVLVTGQKQIWQQLPINIKQ
ncbi:hypothetical protein EYF80_012015 [Liparis tanakae]|uniref:Uncharacterized protein n=1 Tax=Liparis tanakae TaxID=230148 RepID=A0A4Z2IIU3_9TELE|nr:hypothetical protein EYF80_012015 [Liparis tanakae]